MKVELKILDDRISGLNYATAGAAAVDLRACTLDPLGTPKPIIEKINLYPGHKVKIGAGVALSLATMNHGEDASLRFAAIILPRSGLGTAGIQLSNVVGLIDEDFQGEIVMAIENRGEEVYVLEPTSRLAQMYITPVIVPHFEVVDQFSAPSERGAGGFGSTGTV